MRKYVSRRCTYHRECDIIWKMDGSKCEDVEVGPFADKDFDQPMESGKNDIQFTVIAMFIFFNNLAKQVVRKSIFYINSSNSPGML